MVFPIKAIQCELKLPIQIKFRRFANRFDGMELVSIIREVYIKYVHNFN